MSQTNDIRQIRIRSRVDTPENWEKENPVLLEREIGYETNGKYKIGDGTTQWNWLEYAASGNLNLENGEGENSLQQKSNTESFQIYNNPEIAELLAKGEIIGEISEDGRNINIKTGAFGNNSIAIGGRLQAGRYAYAEGNFTLASGEGSHAEGWSTKAIGDTSHTEGHNTTASGRTSHAEGNVALASGNTSHAEGWHTIASGHELHTEGAFTLASGYASHAEGSESNIPGELKISGLANTLTYSIIGELDTYIENFLNSFLKSNEYNPDYRTIQCVYQSTVFNITNIDLNQKTLTLEKTLSSHDLNNEIITFDFGTTASGWVSHAEGGGTIADGSYSHAEGGGTIADGSYSHAEGYKTIADGWASHAEGCRTIASEYCSHAEGYHTIAKRQYQHVQGSYNIPDKTSAFIIGNGVREDEYDETTGELIQQYRFNAMTVDRSGNAWFGGKIQATPTKNLYITTQLTKNTDDFDNGKIGEHSFHFNYVDYGYHAEIEFFGELKPSGTSFNTGSMWLDIQSFKDIIFKSPIRACDGTQHGSIYIEGTALCFGSGDYNLQDIVPFRLIVSSENNYTGGQLLLSRITVSNLKRISLYGQIHYFTNNF